MFRRATLVAGLLVAPLPLLLAQQLRQRTDPVERTSREGQPALVLSEQQVAKLREREHLLSQATALAKQHKWLESIALVEKSLDLLRQVHDELHPDVAKTWQILGELHADRGDYPAARRALEEFIRLQQRRLGRNHWQTTDAVLLLDHVVFESSAAPAAKARLQQAFQLVSLGIAESHHGQFRKAEEPLRQALAIYREVLGEENRHTFTCLSRLAAVLTELGQHAEAEKLHRHGLAVTQRVLGEDHPNVAVGLGDLAWNVGKQGRYAEAEKLGRQALAAGRRIMGDDDPQTVPRLSNVALFLKAQGRYAEAEALYRQALDIQSRFPDAEHGTAVGLASLAQIMFDQGKDAEAEQLHRAALAIFRKPRWAMHPHTAIALTSLAANLSRQGKHEEAEKLDREALAVCRAALGDEHLLTANCLSNLGRALLVQGQQAEGEKLFLQSLAIYHKIGGDNLNVADSLRYLAANWLANDRYEEAAKVALRALAIFHNILGEEHHETGLCLDVLAQILHADGDFDRAEQTAQRAARAFLSLRLHVGFAGLDRSGFYVRSPLAFLAAVQARHGKAREAWQSYEQYLGRGLLDDMSGRSNRPLSDAERASEETLLGQLTLLDNRLHDLVAANNAAEADRVRSARDRVLLELTALQSALVKRYGLIAGEVYDLPRIQRQLSDDTALVSWLDFDSPAKAKDPRGEHWGVVVRRQGAPRWVRISGSGADGAWTQRDSKVIRDARQLLQSPNIDSAVDWQAALDDLARQRLRPLAPHLDGVKRLIVLPSAAMAGIPLGTLTDAYEISYAPSASLYAWLLEQRKPAAGGDSLLALADPIFSAEQEKLAPAVGTIDPLARLLRGLAPRPLPGTRREVEAVAGLFASRGGHVQQFLGAQASALNLGRLASKNELARFRYVHLATHGYPDPQGGLNSYLALTSENPAVLSHSKLTAGQMLRTWKLNADLVTLSACETALGQHQGGEGYVGFAQALLLAGGRSLVLSQWPADDRATALLMRRFYQNLLGMREGLPGPMVKVEALGEAQGWLRRLSRQEVIAHLQALMVPFQEAQLGGAEPFEHPFFWAPFILVGDPGYADQP
jgi:CHAT domain-containing protein/tetratricopeptide (TPR) repeat protein